MHHSRIAAIARMKQAGWRVDAIAKHYEISVEMVLAALVEAKVVSRNQWKMRLGQVKRGY
jgi:uncharacterized protein (DUF433 family)